MNDEGKFVLLPCECAPYCRPCKPKCKRVIVHREEVIREPFKAHTLGIKRTAVPYSTPVRFEQFDRYTQSGCAGGFGSGWYGGIY